MVILPIFVLVVALLALFVELKARKRLLYVLLWLSVSIWAFRAIITEVF